MMPSPTPEDCLRGRVYSLTARLVAGPPDHRLLSLLKQIPQDPSAEGEMATAWAGLREAALFADPEREATEYDRLFNGITGRGVLPYASWYRNGLLAAEPLAEIRRDLHRFGFERAPGSSEPEDHAAALLETMAMLCAKHPECDQAVFFCRHLFPWIGRFFSDLAKFAETAFYRAAGNLGQVFTDFEIRWAASGASPNPGDHISRQMQQEKIR